MCLAKPFMINEGTDVFRVIKEYGNQEHQRDHFGIGRALLPRAHH